MRATSVQEGFANLVICKFDSAPTCIRTWKTKVILVNIKIRTYIICKIIAEKLFFFYLLKKCFAQIRLYKLIFTHSLPALTINNYYFCFKNMNIIFCNRIRGCRLTKYPGPFVCILLIMEAQHVLRNGIGIEENICNTVQLTRTMAVENYACFIKNIKDLILQNLAF